MSSSGGKDDSKGQTKTSHTIVIADSRTMSEIGDSEIELIVTSPPYPMIEMWDNLLCRTDTKIASLWQEL